MRAPLNRQPVTGTADGAGAALIPIPPRPSWTACYFACRAVGSAGYSPVWIIEEGVALPLAVGQGMQTGAGPVLCEPGKGYSLRVSGGPPAAQLVAQAVGWTADTPEELLAPQTAGAGPTPVLGAAHAVFQRQFGAGGGEGPGDFLDRLARAAEDRGRRMGR